MREICRILRPMDEVLLTFIALFLQCKGHFARVNTAIGILQIGYETFVRHSVREQ